MLAFFDIETFSPVPISAGLDNYARPAEIIMAALRIPSQERRLFWDMSADSAPAEILNILESPEYLLVAWNVSFERTLLRHCWNLDIPAHRWLDAMVMARAASLPGSLDLVGRILGLPADTAKMNAGKALIRFFCVPRKPSPKKPHHRNLPEHDRERWAQFGEYCRRDVDAMVEIFHRLPRHILNTEPDLWRLDLEINQRGLPVDMDLVRSAQRIVERNEREKMAQLAELTGLANPGSRVQLLPWLQEHGYPHQTVEAAVLESSLEDPQLDQLARDAIRLKVQLSKASVKKYAALVSSVGPDDRLRHGFVLLGASRTGRWTGRGFQPQNLPRPTIPEHEAELAAELLSRGMVDATTAMFDAPMEAVSTSLRAAIRAPAGRRLVVADLAAIESRVLGYCCQEPAILDVFRGGRDVYREFATQLFGVPYHKVTKAQRTIAKPAVLGCGYMLGGPTLQEYAAGMGVEMTLEEAQEAKTAWRRAHPQVVAHWRELEACVMATIRDGKPRHVGVVQLEKPARHLVLRLPSGRVLLYADAQVEDQEKPWGEVGPTVVYSGWNGKAWVRTFTHPGKLVENVVQAIARDVLAVGLLRADRAGLTVVGHVHDEIICEEPEHQADAALEQLVACMTEAMPWAPDLPLDAAGYVAERYRKD